MSTLVLFLGNPICSGLLDLSLLISESVEGTLSLRMETDPVSEMLFSGTLK
jgi:hypothetical protein